MNEIDLIKAKDLAVSAVCGVEQQLRNKFGQVEYETKSDPDDMVTEMDKWAEREISRVLGGFSSDIATIGEEYGASGESDAYWTIDSIDGTSGYVRGVDYCTTMVSLVVDQTPVVGVINDFNRREVFWAAQGQGSYRNGVPIKVSDRSADDSRQVEFYIKNDTFGSNVRHLARESGFKVRSTGGTGRVLSLIAAGSNEGFLSFNNSWATIWDYAPGLVLAREAGAQIRNIDKSGAVLGKFSIENFDLVIANSEETLEALAGLIAGTLDNPRLIDSHA